MKKQLRFITSIFTMVLMLFLFGCNSNNTPVVDNNQQIVSIYNLAVEVNATELTYEEWITSIEGPQGESGKEVILQVADGYIQWQYVGDSTWINLIELVNLVESIREDITITYELDDGDFTEEHLSSEIISELSTLDLPMVEKEGYTFLGWYTGSSIFDIKTSNMTIFTSDTTLYAEYEIIQYEIQVFDQEGILQNTSVEDYGYSLADLGYEELFSDIDLSQIYAPELLGDSDLTLYINSDITFTMGANIYSFEDHFMSEVVLQELERYALELGVELEVVDSEFSQAKLNSQVDAFIAQGVDVLLIDLVDAAAAGTIIEKAKAADIPLIFFFNEPTEAGIMDTYDKVWYVGSLHTFGGVVQGEMMVEEWTANPEWDLNSDGILQYVLLQGDPEHPYAIARTSGAIQAFTDAGITIEELAIQSSDYWSTVDADDIMREWLDTAWADDIEMVICNNDGMAFGAINAMAFYGVDIPVYGIDAIEEAITKIGTGELNGTVLINGVGQARAILDLALNAANGVDVLTGTEWVLDSPTGTKAVRVPYIAVTIDNYEDYQ